MDMILRDVDAIIRSTTDFQVAPDVGDLVRTILSGPLNGCSATIFVIGPPGRGKTTLLNAIEADLDAFHSEVGDGHGTFLRISCDSEMRSTDLFRAALQACKKPAPARQSAFYLGEQLSNAFSDYDYVILLIDDVDHVDEIEPFLNFLRRDPCDDTEPAIGAVMTHRCPDVLTDVDPRTTAHLSPWKLGIEAPDQSQWKGILQSRIEHGMAAGSVTTAAMERLAQFLAPRTGNIRNGLTFLIWAAVFAEHDGADTVRTHHVRAAEEEWDPEREAETLLPDEFSIHHRALLAVLIQAQRNGHHSVSTSEAFDRYRTVMTDTDQAPLSKRRFRDRLKELDRLPVVTVEKHTQPQGPRQWEAKLICDPRIVETVLSKYTDLDHYQDTVDDARPSLM